MINNNIDRSEIKLGYFGPGLSGRRTNIQYLYDQVSNAHQLGIKKEYVPNYGHIISAQFISTTIIDEQHPLKIKLFGCTGATGLGDDLYKIVDSLAGIIFVVDSQYERIDANLSAYYQVERLRRKLARAKENIPLVLQLNKRDCKNILTRENLVSGFGVKDYMVVEAVAYQGIGIQQSFDLLIDQVTKI